MAIRSPGVRIGTEGISSVDYSVFARARGVDKNRVDVNTHGPFCNDSRLGDACWGEDSMLNGLRL